MILSFRSLRNSISIPSAGARPNTFATSLALRATNGLTLFIDPLKTSKRELRTPRERGSNATQSAPPYSRARDRVREHVSRITKSMVLLDTRYDKVSPSYQSSEETNNVEDPNSVKTAEAPRPAGTDLCEIDVSKLSSPVLARLIEEVRNEEPSGIDAYSRFHNRHNRSR